MKPKLVQRVLEFLRNAMVQDLTNLNMPQFYNTYDDKSDFGVILGHGENMLDRSMSLIAQNFGDFQLEDHDGANPNDSVSPIQDF